MVEQRIVGIGGGFGCILDYALGLARKPRPRLVWVGTASNALPAQLL